MSPKAEMAPMTEMTVEEAKFIMSNTRCRKPKIIKDEELSKKFADFYDKEWNANFMYTPSDFIEKFGINRHLARYYLMAMLYDSKVFRVKYSNKTFYGLYDLKLIDRFKEFIWMGVEVKWIAPRSETIAKSTASTIY